MKNAEVIVFLIINSKFFSPSPSASPSPFAFFSSITLRQWHDELNC